MNNVTKSICFEQEKVSVESTLSDCFRLIQIGSNWIWIRFNLHCSVHVEGPNHPCSPFTSKWVGLSLRCFRWQRSIHVGQPFLLRHYVKHPRRLIYSTAQGPKARRRWYYWLQRLFPVTPQKSRVNQFVAHSPYNIGVVMREVANQLDHLFYIVTLA